MKLPAFSAFCCSIIIVTMAACSNTRYLSGKLKSSTIEELEFFDPVSVIAFVPEKNDAIVDDSLSLSSARMIAEEILQAKDILPPLHPVVIKDDSIQTQVSLEIYKACKASSAYNSIDVLPIPPTADKIIEAKGKRFGLVVCYTGFKRSKDSNEWAKRRRAVNTAFSAFTLSVNAYTLGAIQPFNAKKSSVTFSAMILDAYTNKIIFFNEFLILEQDPLDKQRLAKKIDELFRQYFTKAAN